MDGVDDGGQQSRARHELLQQHRTASAIGDRHPPVGVLLIGPGLVLRPPIAHDIRQRDADEPGRRLRHRRMQRDTDLRQPLIGLETDVPAEPAVLSQHLGPCLPLTVGMGALNLNRCREQAEFGADANVLVAQVPGRRWQVVHVDARQHVAPPVQRIPDDAVDGLEPQDAGTEDPSLDERLLHPRLNRAEVLTDDDGAGPIGLEHEDAEHRVVVEPNKGAR